MGNIISISTTIDAPLSIVWKTFTQAEHIMNWNAASDDWHCPFVSVNLVVGGKQVARMEAKDGSFGFDFGYTFSKIDPEKELVASMDDGRSLQVLLSSSNNQTLITENFEAEEENSEELQKEGWFSILTNFKKYVESLNI